MVRSFLNLFRRPRTKPRPAAPRRARLVLEPLESRQVPSVTYHGGPVVENVEVETVYFGSAWNGAVLHQQNGYMPNRFVPVRQPVDDNLQGAPVASGDDGRRADGPGVPAGAAPRSPAAYRHPAPSLGETALHEAAGYHAPTR